MSVALKADGLNNTTDIISSIAVLIGLRISQRPADLNHPYGHLRAETIASLIASFIMLLVGLQVLNNCIQSILTPVDHVPSSITGVVAIISAVIMFLVYRYNLALSLKVKSAALKATAYDNRSDALVSIGTAIGIFCSILGFPIIDVVTGLIVGLIIMKTAIEIFWEAVQSLADGIDVRAIEEITDIVRRVDGVKSIINVKGRTHSNTLLVDINIAVQPTLTIMESYVITKTVEEAIKQHFPSSAICIEVSPYYSHEFFNTANYKT